MTIPERIIICPTCHQHISERECGAHLAGHAGPPPDDEGARAAAITAYDRVWTYMTNPTDAFAAGWDAAIAYTEEED